MASEQNVDSQEVNEQYTIDPKQPDSTEPRVEIKASFNLKSLPIPPNSYLMLGPSILEVPFNTLAPATATKANLMTRLNLLITKASTEMVDADARCVLGEPTFSKHWPRYSDETIHTIDLSSMIRDGAPVTKDSETEGGNMRPPHSEESQPTGYTPNFKSVKTAIQESRAVVAEQAKALQSRSREASQLFEYTFKECKNVPVLSKRAIKKAVLREIQVAREAEANTLLEDTEETVMEQEAQDNDLSYIRADNCLTMTQQQQQQTENQVAFSRKNLKPPRKRESVTRADRTRQTRRLFVLKEEVDATLVDSDYDLQLAKGQIVLLLCGPNASKMVHVALVGLIHEDLLAWYCQC